MYLLLDLFLYVYSLDELIFNYILYISLNFVLTEFKISTVNMICYKIVDLLWNLELGESLQIATFSRC